MADPADWPGLDLPAPRDDVVDAAVAQAADDIRRELERWGYKVPTRPVLELIAIKAIACYVVRRER